MEQESIRQIRLWYDVMRGGSELTEVRTIGKSSSIASGYFDNVEDIIRCVSARMHENVYFIINGLNSACSARTQQGRLMERCKSTTSDADIQRRTFVLIDVDSERIADVNANTEEKEAAHLVAAEVYKFLVAQGFEEPIVADSGNGYHIYLKCDMEPNADNSKLIRRFLFALDMLFSNEKVKIDTKVFNNARISKVWGTFSRKGCDTPDRPQRMCRALRVPREVRVTKEAYFRKVAELYQERQEPTRYNGYNTERFDIDAFIERNGIEVTHRVRVTDGTRYILSHCVFDENHKNKDAMIFVHDSGALAYHCFHNSCSGKTWRDVREKFEPKTSRYGASYTYGGRITLPTEKSAPNEPKIGKNGQPWLMLSEIGDEDRSKIVSIPSGVLDYDRNAYGFDKPSLNVWSGNNGSAKSTLLNQIAMNAVDRGFKVAMYSGELKPERMRRWIVQQLAGKWNCRQSTFNANDYYVDKRKIQQIAQWLDGKYYLYNNGLPNDFAQLRAEIERLVRDKNIDMVVLDNLSCIDISDMDRESLNQQKAVIRSLVDMVHKLGVVCHLVVHPRKMTGFLRKEDIAGTKTITDLADNVFIVHRFNDDTRRGLIDFYGTQKGTAIVGDYERRGVGNFIQCVKHREFGATENKLYPLWYEVETRRLKNSVEESYHYGWESQDIETQMEMLPQSIPCTEDVKIDHNAVEKYKNAQIHPDGEKVRQTQEKAPKTEDSGASQNADSAKDDYGDKYASAPPIANTFTSYYDSGEYDEDDPFRI